MSSEIQAVPMKPSDNLGEGFISHPTPQSGIEY